MLSLFHVLNFRNINAFLNTGKGGTIYLGIVDDGKVKGLFMTQYQVSIKIILTVHLHVLGNWGVSGVCVICGLQRIQAMSPHRTVTP